MPTSANLDKKSINKFDDIDDLHMRSQIKACSSTICHIHFMQAEVVLWLGRGISNLLNNQVTWLATFPLLRTAELKVAPLELP